MIKDLSYEIIQAILDALPVEISFVDKDDKVRYFSKEGRRIFPRTRAII
ncbi:MAG: PAS domain-containing protein, partial [Candidatus Bathyarchaeota archaeon]|nr:PAS domain-containing protein [Candidatus Bathyarchaeota archaeon]